VREKSKSVMKYPLVILQRVLRIWPSYILAMMIYYSFYMRLGQGPLWSSQEPTVMLCQYMWRDIFFINNFVENGKEMCLNWGWYLQVDFQIFIVCVLLLFLYGKIHHNVSYLTGAVLVVGSITFNIVYTQMHNQKLFTNVEALMSYTNYLLDVYIKPYARWTPYFMGLYLGLFYYDFQKACKNHDERRSKPVEVMFMLKEKF
jgi:peptidoglycan/LPS O-acetylase OafA/YrhL